LCLEDYKELAVFKSGGNLRIFLDVTSTHVSGVKTGIQRVVRSLATEIAKLASEHAFEFSLVVCNPSGASGYVILNQLEFDSNRKPEAPNINLNTVYDSEIFTSLKRISVLLKRIDILGVMSSRLIKGLSNKIVETLHALRQGRVRRETNSHFDFKAGDVLLVADAFWVVPNFLSSIIRAKRSGAKVVFLVNDIFPITYPDFTEPNNKELFNRTIFDALDLADGLLYPSNVTKDDIIANIMPDGIIIPNKLVHYGVHKSKTNWLYEGKNRIPGSILMLGTVEPRKNHMLVLKWFLSQAPDNTILTVIGAEGWMNESVISTLRRESNRGQGLSWLEKTSDEDLAYEMTRHEIGIYASHAEGFGLPILEYSAGGLKLVLSDIPVFREVAGDSGFYFDQNSVESLNKAISRATAQRNISAIPVVSWADTAVEVLDFIKSAVGR